jgi:hypothetical protein
MLLVTLFIVRSFQFNFLVEDLGLESETWLGFKFVFLLLLA